MSYLTNKDLVKCHAKVEGMEIKNESTFLDQKYYKSNFLEKKSLLIHKERVKYKIFNFEALNSLFQAKFH